MCEATVTSPVNTGEQSLAETAPTPAETNGQSQLPPGVVTPVSSRADDRAQPPPEQVAPPTATDVCPELSSQGAVVVVNKIPPRGRDDTILHNISFLNQIISNMARDNNQNILCLDPCPKMFWYYAKDKVRLNRSGKRFYVYRLAKSLIKFHWPQLQGTR